MLLTIAAFGFVLGVLILVHELGHFIAAKLVGIGVPRFSIGFGPATPVRFRHGETDYQISWFPLGGYVKMASREEQEAMEALEGGALEDNYPPEKLFESKSLGARVFVISAGVIMNALFAWVVYSGMAAFLGRVEDPNTAIARVDPDVLPAAAEALAGLPFGTRIIRVNGDTARSWEDFQEGVLDPTSSALLLEFSGEVAPVSIPIPGIDTDDRQRILQAVEPLWEPRVGIVDPGQPAARAGLMRGDLILRAAGDTIPSWGDLVRAVEGSLGDSLVLSVLRADSILDVAVVPAERSIQDPITGETRKAGRIGIGRQADFKHVRYGIGGAVVQGARETGKMAGLVFFTLKGMVVGSVSPKELGGPILIGQAAGQFASLGIAALFNFMAFLSVNLAILNLLPIPVLDGGHLLFLLAEGVRGRPLSLTVRMRLTQVGLFLLLGIMALAITNDLFRVFRG
ncbi:MAG: RIP metalloprotease RseP [Gemmatimonadales bacterium]